MKFDLQHFLESPESVDEVSLEALPALLVDISALLSRLVSTQARIAARLRMLPEAEHDPNEDRLVDARAAADYLRLKRVYLYALIREGRFPAVRVGKYVRIRVGDIKMWVHRATTPTPAPDPSAKERVRRLAEPRGRMR